MTNKTVSISKVISCVSIFIMALFLLTAINCKTAHAAAPAALRVELSDKSNLALCAYGNKNGKWQSSGDDFVRTLVNFKISTGNTNNKFSHMGDEEKITVLIGCTGDVNFSSAKFEITSKDYWIGTEKYSLPAASTDISFPVTLSSRIGSNGGDILISADLSGNGNSKFNNNTKSFDLTIAGLEIPPAPVADLPTCQLQILKVGSDGKTTPVTKLERGDYFKLKYVFNGWVNKAKATPVALMTSKDNLPLTLGHGHDLYGRAKVSADKVLTTSTNGEIIGLRELNLSNGTDPITKMEHTWDVILQVHPLAPSSYYYFYVYMQDPKQDDIVVFYNGVKFSVGMPDPAPAPKPTPTPGSTPTPAPVASSDQQDGTASTDVNPVSSGTATPDDSGKLTDAAVEINGVPKVDAVGDQSSLKAVGVEASVKDGKLVLSGEPKNVGTFTITVSTPNGDRTVQVTIREVAKATETMVAPGRSKTEWRVDYSGSSMAPSFVMWLPVTVDSKDGFTEQPTVILEGASGSAVVVEGSGKGASTKWIKITGSVSDRSKAAVKSVKYRVGSVVHTQDVNVKLTDTQFTDKSTGQAATGSSGGGCDAGFGAIALLAAAGALIIRRK